MELYLDNFRSFKSQNFKFSKINILIGENSSGKSSILKFFLALKQSLQSFQNRSAINLTLQGDYVDLGNYEEMIYYQNVDNKLTFSFKFDQDYPVFYRDFLAFPDPSTDKPDNNILKVFNYLKKYPTTIEFTFDKELKKHEKIHTIISNSKLGVLEIIPIDKVKQEAGNVLSNNPLCQLIFTNTRGKSITFENIEYEKEAFFSMIKGYSLYNNFGKSKYEFYKLAFLLITQNYLEAFLKKVQFINPINSIPKRFFFKKDPSSSYIHLNLEELINIFADDSLEPEKLNKTISNINKAIKFFGIADEIKINRDSKIPVVELKAKIRDLWSNITDVGYGTSLQLPILFQIIISNNKPGGENILIEQPEVHLHPSLQARFIETIIKYGPKNVYFVETHSEHIIRKLQVIVKKGLYGIKPEDISIHYFKRENAKTNVTYHEINKDGKLSPNFPSGFFDSSYLLAKELI